MREREKEIRVITEKEPEKEHFILDRHQALLTLGANTPREGGGGGRGGVVYP